MARSFKITSTLSTPSPFTLGDLGIELTPPFVDVDLEPHGAEAISRSADLATAIAAGYLTIATPPPALPLPSHGTYVVEVGDSEGAEYATVAAAIAALNTDPFGWGVPGASGPIIFLHFTGLLLGEDIALTSGYYIDGGGCYVTTTGTADKATPAISLTGDAGIYNFRPLIQGGSTTQPAVVLDTTGSALHGPFFHALPESPFGAATYQGFAAVRGTATSIFTRLTNCVMIGAGAAGNITIEAPFAGIFMARDCILNSITTVAGGALDTFFLIGGHLATLTAASPITTAYHVLGPVDTANFAATATGVKVVGAPVRAFSNLATGTVYDYGLRSTDTPTDNAVARYDGATGKLLQSSGVTIDDSGNLAATGTISSPGAGADSERLGALALAAGARSVAAGKNANAGGAESVAAGRSASSGGASSIAVGYAAAASQSGATAVGRAATGGAVNATVVGSNATVTGAGSMALGANAITGAYTNALAIGLGAAATANNDGRIGTVTNQINLTVHGKLSATGIITAPGLDNYVTGLDLDYATAASITIGAGAARNSTNAYDLVVAAPLTVSLAVSGAGGLDTGSEAASSWYAVHLIGDSTGVLAPVGLFSLSATAPSLPTGYDVFRRIGWVRNNVSSDLLSQSTSGGRGNRETFYLNTLVDRAVLSSGAAVGITSVSMATLVPTTGNSADVKVRESGTVALLLYFPDGATLFDGYLVGNEATIEYPVQGSQTIYYAHVAVGGLTDIWVAGYEESL